MFELLRWNITALLSLHSSNTVDPLWLYKNYSTKLLQDYSFVRCLPLWKHSGNGKRSYFNPNYVSRGRMRYSTCVTRSWNPIVRIIRYCRLSSNCFQLRLMVSNNVRRYKPYASSPFHHLHIHAKADRFSPIERVI